MKLSDVVSRATVDPRKLTDPELFDVVELLVDLPDHRLRMGARGAIVHCYPDDTYDVEFTNEEGETLALCPLTSQQFIVVWRARTQTWVPIADQVAVLVAHLPEGAEHEVLDFALFLHARERSSLGEALAMTMRETA